MDLYLIRHTRLALEPGICYGQSEIALADSFAGELENLRPLLPESFDRSYSSPLQRCRQLAEVFAEQVEIDARLLEYHFGEWELSRWNDIDKAELDHWMRDFVNVRPPGGDTLIEMSARVGDFIDTLRGQPLERVLVVTHAGVIRCIWAKLLQIPLQQVFKFNVGYARPLRIRLGESAEFDQLFTDTET